MEPKNECSPVGVGCFHFVQLQGQSIEDFDFEAYPQSVVNYLEEYPGIDEIDCSELSAIHGSQRDEADDDMSNGFGIYPWPIRWRVSFTVNIPDRIQNEIMIERYAIRWESISNNFRVDIYYRYDLPVVFIRANGTPVNHPSDWIILIREYLVRYAPKSDDIGFQFLGPSPFHADLYISRSKESNVKITLKDGYDEISLNIDNEGGLSDISGKENYVLMELVRYFGLYYWIVQTINRVNDEWITIQEKIDTLSEDLLERRNIARKSKSIFCRSKSDILSLELISWEIDIDLQVDDINRKMREVKEVGSFSELEYYLEKSLGEEFDFPTERYHKILEILGNHEKLSLVTRVTIYASLIGFLAAILGSLVSSF